MQEIKHEVQDHAMEVAMHYNREAQANIIKAGKLQRAFNEINEDLAQAISKGIALTNENETLRAKLKKANAKLKSINNATKGE